MRTLRLGSTLLPLLAGCRFLEPSYVEVSPYVQYGEHDFDRPVSSFDEETWGVEFTVGWLVGVQYEAMRNLAALDVSKSGQLTLRDDYHAEAAPVEVHVDGGGPDEITVEQESAIPVELSVPETTDDAIKFFIWAGGILLLAAAAFLAHRVGISLPFLKSKKEKSHDRDDRAGG